jgi:ATP-dependent DNA helicase RecQ
MAQESVQRLRTIIDYLTGEGYLGTTGDQYPVITKTARSGEIIFEKKPLHLMLAKKKPQEKTISGWSVTTRYETPADLDDALFNTLKDLRTRLAKEAGVPSYIVFSDATLRDMCRKLPETQDAFLAVSGVGAVKAEKYADVFIHAIRERDKKNGT